MTTWAELLEQLPNLADSGMGDGLKLDTGELRVWLSHTASSTEDGFQYDRNVAVEELKGGRWVIVGEFDGDIDDPHPFGPMGDAYRATIEAVKAAEQ